MAERTPFLEVPVGRVMTVRPDTVGPEDALGDAAGRMVEGGYRHLPVVDVDGRLVGMLSERDLRARLGSELERFPDAGRELLASTVESAMSPNPIRVGPRATLREVLETLTDDRIGALPVVDEADRLVGIVSYVDALAYLREGAPPARQLPRKTARPTTSGEPRKRPRPVAKRRSASRGRAERKSPPRNAPRARRRRGAR